jgi:hypothetical protein
MQLDPWWGKLHVEYSLKICLTKINTPGDPGGKALGSACKESRPDAQESPVD